MDRLSKLAQIQFGPHPSHSEVKRFRRLVSRYYEDAKRRFPWRSTRDPYKILVSEVMLQQTQTDRVRAHYQAFIKAFPSFPVLAESPIANVLKAWSGLGYNRRAFSLHRTAELVVEVYDGKLPCEEDALRTLPGIGLYTARAIRAFAFNIADPFIETNIRTVIINHFFSGEARVSDKQVLEVVAKTLDARDPRSWYYALMDYGSALKKMGCRAHQKSTHYRKQSPFSGSVREMRGVLIKALSVQGKLTAKELRTLGPFDGERVSLAITALQRDGLIIREGKHFVLGRIL